MDIASLFQYHFCDETTSSSQKHHRERFSHHVPEEERRLNFESNERLREPCQRFYHSQKQPSEVFYKRAVLKNIAIFSGKHLSQSLFLINLQAFRLLQHSCFPQNIAKFLRTASLKNITNSCFCIQFTGNSQTMKQSFTKIQINRNQKCIQNPVKHLRWIFFQKQLKAENFKLFSQKASSQMFDRVLNMLLESLCFLVSYLFRQYFFFAVRRLRNIVYF